MSTTSSVIGVGQPSVWEETSVCPVVGDLQ